MKDFIVLTLAFTGAGVFLLAALGLIRFPDFFTRMAAASKASTLSVLLLSVAAALEFAGFESMVKIAFAIFFLFLSTPVSAHLLGRTAWRTKMEVSPRTRVDPDSDRI